MNLLDNNLYLEDLDYICNLDLPYEKLQDKNILISGASGLLGSFLIDVLMRKNLNCHIYALLRNKEKAEKRFSSYLDNDLFTIIAHDISKPLELEDKMDYIIHLASNTHPLQYSTQPITTVTTNILGLINLLEKGVNDSCVRFVFASSVEIYGQNRGDTEYFDEDYCGYINCNTLRAGYPESKRCGEALCQAYIKEKDLDIVIPRFSRSYGPSMLRSDTKAISQFINKALNNEDIILKSEGKQLYSYSYMADAISGLLTVMLKGEKGQAYNIADKDSDITLKDLASLIASYAGKEVIFELPDSTEKAGYSTATKAILNSNKLQQLGWQAHYPMAEGLKRTLDILKS